MKNLLLVGIGGFFGALSRFGLSQWVRTYSFSFPLATLLVNVGGAFVCGFFYEYWRGHPNFAIIQLTFIVGFLGAFTTFSAFSFETLELIRANNLALAMANVGLNLILCLAAVYLGGLTAQ